MKGTANLRLKAAIVLSGKTMSEIAKLIGTPKSNLSRKIHGYTRFNEDEIYKISKILDVPITDIFFAQEVTESITNNSKGA